MKQVIDRTTIFLYGFLIITAFILFFSCTEDMAGSDVGNEVAISLTGKVLNKNSEGVPGVIAKLARLGFYDVTNYQGKYSILASYSPILGSNKNVTDFTYYPLNASVSFGYYF